MRNIYQLVLFMILLLLGSLVYAENPAVLTLQVNNQLSEPFTFVQKNSDNKGVALTNQNMNVLAVSLTADKHKGCVIIYDQNNQEVARLHYALHALFTYVMDGALAGPDWEWEKLEVKKKTEHPVTVTIIKHPDATCAENNIEACSQTAEIQISA